MELAKRTRVRVEAEVAAKVAEHGSVEEIQEKISKAISTCILWPERPKGAKDEVKRP